MREIDNPTSKGGQGRGLFPLLALMSHSCQSNLQHEQSKSTGAMVLSTQRLIEAGEELTIRYIDTIQGKVILCIQISTVCKNTKSTRKNAVENG